METTPTKHRILGHLTGRSYDPGHLCDRCRDISLAAIQSGYLLHPSFRSLVNSAASCRMCELVSHRLRNVIKQYTQLGGSSSEQAVTLVPHEIPGKVWVHALNLKLGELWLYAHPDTMTKEPRQVATTFVDVERITLPLLASTLEDCVHGRGQCCMPYERKDASQISLPPPLPRRILDLNISSDDKTLSVCLHESKPGERSFYAALSHRWGKAIPSKTTKANISLYKDGIHHNSLPNTFKDAISVTRRLGFKYLWIDALCIIQDDLNDWESQAPFMGAIFQNAACTILAHSARDSSCGFLTTIPGSEMVEIYPRRSTRSNEKDKMYLGLPWSFHAVVLTSHIMQRGWIQQEIELSRRLLHFSNGLVYWQCPHTAKPKPLGFTTELHSYSNSRMNKMENLEEDIEESWIAFVEHYSTCELTFETDRLVAIDGIARVCTERLENRTAPKYRYGHFIHNPRSLLWAANREVKSKKKDVPSWSWASTKETVKFMRLRSVSSGYQNRSLHMPAIFSTTEISTIDASIVSMNESSVPRTCELVVQAQTRTLELRREQKGPFPSTWWRMWPDGSPTGFQLQQTFGTVWFDHYPDEKPSLDKKTKEDTSPSIQVHCARISTFEHADGNHDNRLVNRAFGVLLLQPGNREQSFFKRVGVGLITQSDWFQDNNPTQTLCIR